MRHHSRLPALLIFIQLVVLASSPAHAAPILESRRLFALSDRMNAIALGDFNEDGLPDVAVAHSYLSFGVYILLGIEPGRFTSPVNIATPGGVADVLALDVNEDGHLDVVGSGSQAALVVLLGNGAGGFGAPVYTGTQGSGFMTSADFDEDGNLDVVISRGSNSLISVYWGDGAGGFSGPLGVGLAGPGPRGLVTGDFQVDGHADVAVALASGNVVLFPGNGTRVFGPSYSGAVGSSLYAITSADMNADGIDDLAVSDSTTGTVFLLHVPGDGTFAVAGSVAVGTPPGGPAPRDVAAGDLNRDGLPDLVATLNNQAHTFVATGPFAFSPRRSFSAGAIADALLIDELTGDGLADVLVANILSRDLALLPGDGQGRLKAETMIPMQYSQTPDLLAADFNGDGLTDLAALNAYGPFTVECPGPPGGISCGPQMTLKILPRTGPATFGAPSSAQTRCNPRALAAADFDLDGQLEVVTANQGARNVGVCFQPSLTLMRQDPLQGFIPVQDLQLTDVPSDIATGYFNQDALPDLVVSFGAPFETSRRVQVYLSDAHSVFNPGGSIVLSSAPGPLSVGDLNGDGLDDVAVGTSSGGAFLLGNGLGGLTLVGVCSGAASQGVAIGDFNEDGLVEVASVGGGSITLFHQNEGIFCWYLPEVLPAPQGATGVVMADLDLDGRQDLVVAGNNSVTVIGAGQPLATAESNVYGVFVSTSLATGDFTGDGLLDVATSSSGSGEVSLLINSTPVASAISMQMQHATVAWPPVVNAIAYDVVRGDLNLLHSSGGDFAASVEACVADDITTNALTLGPPPPGGAWWILARPIELEGPRSYDSGGLGQVGTRDPELSSAPACP